MTESALALLPVDLAVDLFDALPDVVFFVKDAAGRYRHVNATLLQRLGRRHVRELIGRAADDVFPPPLGARYAAQDRRVLKAGATVRDQLELHLYPNRHPGWCLTRKLPLREGRRIVGLVGVSRDLGRPDERHPGFARIAAAVDRIRRDYAQPLTIAELAKSAGYSVAQFERHVRSVFALTPRRLIAKTRIDAAMRALESSAPIAHVAQSCGYADHSAFTRQFQASVGMSPRQFRQIRREQRQQRRSLAEG
jgi:AraC-like DNA-binding protein